MLSYNDKIYLVIPTGALIEKPEKGNSGQPLKTPNLSNIMVQKWLDIGNKSMLKQERSLNLKLNKFIDRV